MKTYNFNNGDLRRDIEQIRRYDVPVEVSKSYDGNLDYPYILDVADTGYFYASQEERNADFSTLKEVLKDAMVFC